MDILECGKVLNTHGIRGEIKILPQGVDVDILNRVKTIYIDGEPRTVSASRVHKIGRAHV